MSISTAVPEDHPLMIAWKKYAKSEGYLNSFKWAAHEQHREGSMWGAFSCGWNYADARREFLSSETEEILEAVKFVVSGYLLESSSDARACMARLVDLLREKGE